MAGHKKPGEPGKTLLRRSEAVKRSGPAPGPGDLPRPRQSPGWRGFSAGIAVRRAACRPMSCGIHVAGAGRHSRSWRPASRPACRRPAGCHGSHATWPPRRTTRVVCRPGPMVILNGFGVDSNTLTYSSITGKVTFNSSFATFILNPNLVFQQGSVLYKLSSHPIRHIQL